MCHAYSTRLRLLSCVCAPCTHARLCTRAPASDSRSVGCCAATHVSAYCPALPICKHAPTRTNLRACTVLDGVQAKLHRVVDQPAPQRDNGTQWHRCHRLCPSTWRFPRCLRQRSLPPARTRRHRLHRSCRTRGDPFPLCDAARQSVSAFAAFCDVFPCCGTSTCPRS